jgi:hypothetical protein
MTSGRCRRCRRRASWRATRRAPRRAAAPARARGAYSHSAFRAAPRAPLAPAHVHTHPFSFAPQQPPCTQHPVCLPAQICSWPRREQSTGAHSHPAPLHETHLPALAALLPPTLSPLGRPVTGPPARCRPRARSQPSRPACPCPAAPPPPGAEPAPSSARQPLQQALCPKGSQEAEGGRQGAVPARRPASWGARKGARRPPAPAPVRPPAPAPRAPGQTQRPPRPAARRAAAAAVARWRGRFPQPRRAGWRKGWATVLEVAGIPPAGPPARLSRGPAPGPHSPFATLGIDTRRNPHGRPPTPSTLAPRTSDSA